MTRGHYGSCGKDPPSCWFSDLLGSEPLIRSGFQQTYASDQGHGSILGSRAPTVHWVIVTDDQVERGVNLALERIKASGVLIGGNSFLKFIEVDFAVLVASNAMLEEDSKTEELNSMGFFKRPPHFISLAEAVQRIASNRVWC